MGGDIGLVNVLIGYCFGYKVGVYCVDLIGFGVVKDGVVVVFEIEVEVIVYVICDVIGDGVVIGLLVVV